MFFFHADLVNSCDLMWKQSVWTSVLAAQISSKHLKELVDSSSICFAFIHYCIGSTSVYCTVCFLHSVLSTLFSRGGLLALTGAQAALQGTAGMMGYGLAKAAVHQLVSSLGAADSGLPPNTSVLAVLP